MILPMLLFASNLFSLGSYLLLAIVLVLVSLVKTRLSSFVSMFQTYYNEMLLVYILRKYTYFYNTGDWAKQRNLK